jgi:outer membrane receptor protein involved in Fe transport
VTASSGATPGSSESYTLQKTWGIFLEEGAAIRDRLFLTAAVRSDQNSAFGTKFQRVYYPKASLSWVLSDEDFFPKHNVFSAISSFRLRVANGASGVQPGPNDALRTYNASSASIKNTDAPIETFNAIGNDSLKPERSVEWETGFDSRLFGNRIQFDVTYYSKITHDALISAVIAPSLGSGTTGQRANLGSVKNAGWEATLGGQIIDQPWLGLDFHFSTSLNANKVVSLGTTPPQIAVTNWTVVGYPISGIWAKPIVGYADKNGDGILTVDEVTIRSDTLFSDTVDPVTGKRATIGVGTFRGYAEPRYLTDVHARNRSVQAQTAHSELVRLAWRKHLLQPDGAHSLHAPELQRSVQPGCLARGTGNGRRGDLRPGKDARRLLPAGRIREMARAHGDA